MKYIVNFDGKKLRNALSDHGIFKSRLSRELGYASNYIAIACIENRIRSSVLVTICGKLGVPADTFDLKHEPENEEPQEPFSIKVWFDATDKEGKPTKPFTKNGRTFANVTVCENGEEEFSDFETIADIYGVRSVKQLALSVSRMLLSFACQEIEKEEI